MSRARKAGDAAATEKKLEQKYDEDEAIGTPKAVMDWLAELLHGEVQPIVGLKWDDIQTYLKDGVILCMMLNKLLEQVGKDQIDFKKKAKSAFVAMANVETFSNGCRAYGVAETQLFQTADLVEGRKAQMCNVVQCLNKLGFMANDNGFEPKYNPPAAPKME